MKRTTVSDLAAALSGYLSKVSLNDFLIAGELSNVKIVNGHGYFNLKDEKAQLACTMWKSALSKLGFPLQDGMQVLVHANLNLYEKRGTLNLNCDRMLLQGEGALMLELMERRKRLAAAGYFNADHKKPRPDEINKVGIVTGETTAALQDALRTIRMRWPMLEVHLFPCSVQGDRAPATIVKALKKADQAGMDAILLIRGGGSFEDLFCFNDESIVKTLYNMNTYTVTGIGHEVDTSLADEAADHRSLTPTAAAQWVTPDQREVRHQIGMLEQAMIRAMKSRFDAASLHLMQILSNPYLSRPQSWLAGRSQRLLYLDQAMQSLMQQKNMRLHNRLENLDGTLRGLMNAQIDQQQRRYARLHGQLLLDSPKSSIEKARFALVLKQKSLQEGPVRLQRECQHQLMHNRQSLQLQGSHFTLRTSGALEQDVLNLEARMKARLEKEKAALQAKSGLLDSLSWQSVLERGFAIVQMEGKILRDSQEAAPGSVIQVQLAKGEMEAVVQNNRNNKNR